MAEKNKRDTSGKANMRFVDQPGQWVDTTPKSVKARQQKAWERLMASEIKKPTNKK